MRGVDLKVGQNVTSGGYSRIARVCLKRRGGKGRRVCGLFEDEKQVRKYVAVVGDGPTLFLCLGYVRAPKVVRGHPL